MSRPLGKAGEIRWRAWSNETFAEAKSSNKLVMLDLSAGWCHWCHVMDRTTYSDPSVIETINANFVPVRVDIDERPDISERYNRGGFPTTAFLSDNGEPVWGGTYIPIADMKRIMSAILAAKSSGEIDQALERSRMQYLDLSKALLKQPTVTGAVVDTIFEDIFSAYDLQNGGFGSEPKFPQPDAIDLLIERYLETSDMELSEAVAHTLDSMTEGIYDKVEGGLFRYSVTRDWKTPHYEKMLDGNAGFLKNLVRAHTAFHKKRFAETAKGTATYMMQTLQDPVSGGFHGSQDADEDYYALSCPQRRRVRQPEVIKAIYAGWNSEAASALIEAGILLQEAAWVDAGKKAFKYSLERLWDEEKGLVRHADRSKVYLFDDQVSFMQSLTAMLELSVDDKIKEIGDRLIEAVDREFKDSEGGYSDVVADPTAIGELSSGRRSMISNSKWAKSIALYGAATKRPDLSEKAKAVLALFGQKEIAAHGVFASSFVSAWWALEKGTVAVEVHGIHETEPWTSPLWQSVKETLSPRAVVLTPRTGETVGISHDQPFAVVCSPQGCSKPVTDPEELKAVLDRNMPSQI